MREIVLTIAAKDYTIRLEDDFARSFNDDLQRLLQGKTQFGVKELLGAFIQKCHEEYRHTHNMDKILGNLDKTLGEIK